MRLRKMIKPPASNVAITRIHERDENTGSVIPKKGTQKRRYIAVARDTGLKKEYYLHATKGWRSVTV